jgi:hypothetical protein
MYQGDNQWRRELNNKVESESDNVKKETIQKRDNNK